MERSGRCEPVAVSTQTDTVNGLRRRRILISLERRRSDDDTSLARKYRISDRYVAYLS
jgi:hypothetical protein